MADFHLACYLNTDRPPLKHPVVTELPVGILGSDLASQIEASLKVKSSSAVACAASARLWEHVLEIHRIPYLLLRVADMRMTLGRKMTALSLYDELQEALQDPPLETWIRQTRYFVMLDTQRQLRAYKIGQGFSASQRWRSTIATDDHRQPGWRHRQADEHALHRDQRYRRDITV